MTILFESYLFPDKLLDIYKSRSKVVLDYAAHNLSKAMYSGLKENGINVRIVNAPNIGSYPSYYKSPFVPGTSLEDGVSVPFCNITYLKRFFIKNKLLKAIEKELRSIAPTEEIALLLYNFRCLPIVSKLKKVVPRLKVVMVVTDLPWNTSMAPSRLMRFGKKIVGTNNDLKQEYLQLVDGYVLLAPKMREALKVENKPWCHLEGIYESDTRVEEVCKEKEKVILYTGNLGKKYGIVNLLDAFDGIKDKDHRLWFRGGGDSKEEIERRIELDSRIQLFPQMSREELLCLQRRATILINPVGPSQKFTNYFFPSKTLEYLASGTPVVMYHLNCMPKEYDEYIYYINEESIEGLRNKMIEVCSLSKEELTKRGQEACAFIMNNKTPKPQMSKVISFIKNLSV